MLCVKGGVGMSGDNLCQAPVFGAQVEVAELNGMRARLVSSQAPAHHVDQVTGKLVDLWEVVFADNNVLAAVERVKANKGAPGVDGVEVDDLDRFMAIHWSAARARLDAGCYVPSPARQVLIPKSAGGTRRLGIPTVLDRVIQQAISQVLSPILDRGFAPTSFGFRPERSAHDGLRAARTALDAGFVWVVEVDLSKYFDSVNHDMLMARVARVVDDKRLLKLIRAYLKAGVLADGVVMSTGEGTPQGSPLSPLLSNVMLDDFDWWQFNKGVRSVRYADDIRVFARSKRSAERAFEQASKYLEKTLKLKVNRDKSSIRPGGKAQFLGMGFYKTKHGFRFSLTSSTKQRFCARLKELTGRSWSVEMSYRVDKINQYVRGWLGYFWIAECRTFLRDVDQHVRRRLRQVCWKQWKRVRTRFRRLIGLGVDRGKAYEWANTSRSYWRISGSWVLTTTLTNQYWIDQGLGSCVAFYDRKRL